MYPPPCNHHGSPPPKVLTSGFPPGHGHPWPNGHPNTAELALRIQQVGLVDFDAWNDSLRYMLVKWLVGSTFFGKLLVLGLVCLPTMEWQGTTGWLNAWSTWLVENICYSPMNCLSFATWGLVHLLGWVRILMFKKTLSLWCRRDEAMTCYGWIRYDYGYDCH